MFLIETTNFCESSSKKKQKKKPQTFILKLSRRKQNLCLTVAGINNSDILRTFRLHHFCKTYNCVKRRLGIVPPNMAPLSQRTVGTL